MVRYEALKEWKSRRKRQQRKRWGTQAEKIRVSLWDYLFDLYCNRERLSKGEATHFRRGEDVRKLNLTVVERRRYWRVSCAGYLYTA